MKRAHIVSMDEGRRLSSRWSGAVPLTDLPWEIIEEEIPKWLPSLHDLLSLSQTCKRLASRHLVKEVNGERMMLTWDKLIKFPGLRSIKEAPNDFVVHPKTMRVPNMQLFPPGWKLTLKTLELTGNFCIALNLARAAFAGLETLTLRANARITPNALAFLTNLTYLHILSAEDKNLDEAIRQLPQLTALKCSYRSATEACLPALVNLQSLDMDVQEITMDSLRCQHSLRECRLETPHIQGDLNLSGFTNLTTLSLNHTQRYWNGRNVDDDTFLGHLFLPPSIKIVQITGFCFANALDAFYDTPRLTDLFLYMFNDWHPQNSSTVYNVLRSLEHVESLDIYDRINGFPDTLDHATRLESLHLNIRRLPHNFCVSHLTRLKVLKLKCDSSGLLDQDLRALTELRKLMIHTKLFPPTNALSSQLAELRRALPQLSVTVTSSDYEDV